MEINGLRFPDELYYDEHHQWARLEDGLVTVGLTDYAQRSSGDVVFIECRAKRAGLRIDRIRQMGRAALRTDKRNGAGGEREAVQRPTDDQ